MFKRKWNMAVLVFLSIFVASCASTRGSKVERQPTVEEAYHKAMKAYHTGLFDEAEVDFKQILDDYPLSPYAVEAELMLGDSAYSAERYAEAGAYYTTFYSFHPSHPKASYSLFQKGMSHFKEVLSADRDQTSTRKALIAFEDLRSLYPESPYAKKADDLRNFLRRRLAENEFYVGRFYMKTKNYKGALMRFSVILKDYGDSGIADVTLYYIGEAYELLGETERARDAFSTLLTEFPQSPYADSARGKLKSS